MRQLLDLLFPPRSDERMIRDATIDDFLPLLDARLIEERSLSAIGLLPFHEPRVRAALHEAKYHGSGHAFTLLAAVLTTYLQEADDLERSKVILIPVPLGKERQSARGHNQVHEMLKRAVRNLDTNRFALRPELLLRTRETPSQVSLPREERERNMHNAFTATDPLDASYVYIIVDDVLTTGATLQAASTALNEAGATHVIPLALAH